MGKEHIKPARYIKRTGRKQHRTKPMTRHDPNGLKQVRNGNAYDRYITGKW